MVYIGNILLLHNKLKEDEILRLGFKSGKAIKWIFKSDTLEKQAGDLKITRTSKTGRCIMIVDPAEVETANLITDKGEYYGN